MAKKQDEKKSFEESMERLDTIVADMESGELSLEDMIARFEEGQVLIKSCSKKLNEVERKVEALVKKEDGTVATEPLDSAEPDAESGPAEEDDSIEEAELF